MAKSLKEFILFFDFAPSHFRGMLVSLSWKTCFLWTAVLLCEGAIGSNFTTLNETSCGCPDQSKKYYYNLEPLGSKEIKHPRFVENKYNTRDLRRNTLTSRLIHSVECKSSEYHSFNLIKFSVGTGKKVTQFFTNSKNSNMASLDSPT